MNIRQCDVLRALRSKSFLNQSNLAEMTDSSIEDINELIETLKKEGFLNKQSHLTEQAEVLFDNRKPKRAIILAAGFGMRMIPINSQTPKAFLKVRNEPLIERIIKQLHKSMILEIHVVVGFMREKFEYLKDKFGVDLIFNPDYASKGNLHSLRIADEYLKNAYIIPCDLWFRESPFRTDELTSWYMVSEKLAADSEVRVNKDFELVRTHGDEVGNSMVGVAYITDTDAELLKERIRVLSSDRSFDDSFWESALYSENNMAIPARIVCSDGVSEINTYEQLRALDKNSEQLNSDVLNLISGVFSVETNSINNISVLKKGMTNRSFLFSCKEKRYIMRIPGEGTDALINRSQEAEVYRIIKDSNLCDKILYIDSENGYKITEYFENARVCDAYNERDVTRCMSFLREFHNLNLQTSHEFNILDKIDFYESLWGGQRSIYKDYDQTKKKAILLHDFIDKHIKRWTLTHIDAVPDNFLFIKDRNGNEKVKLIDWEYAGMQDPDVDIAMFCIYALYNKEQCDRLIDIYFENKCPYDIRTKIYCYIATCGLMWSNWCEYKQKLGVEFGEYSTKQYFYAKEFYTYAKERM